MKPSKQADEHYYIGIMSGTSLDAIDAVLVSINGADISLLASHEAPLSPTLQQQIRELNLPSNNELEKSQQLSQTLAQHFAQAALDVLEQSNISTNQVCAIGCHGQTIRHQPSCAGNLGFSVQIGNGALIAEITNIDTVTDFRSRDIAAQGQGAPLVPAFHQLTFQSTVKSRAIVNIGGMANISFVPSAASSLTSYGFDTGPGNILINHWIQKEKGLTFDYNGDWAKRGCVIPELLAQMLNDNYFKLPPPKSTGREYFDAHWLTQFKLEDYAADDVQATLVELTARSISDAIDNNVEEIYLCGGGAFNGLLSQRIAALSNKPTNTTAALGIAPEWVEAITFAWLAHKTINRETSNLPTATGAKGARILGAIYPA